MTAPKPAFRTYLVLARASNLPTVWSNCLAAWLIGGGTEWLKFWVLILGATFMYTGGMFLNDAFDADFDRRFRPERPIPSGAISEKEVWRWGGNLLALGTLLLVWMNLPTAILSVLLVLAILLYDAVHKVVVFAPVIMAVCRLLLYLVGAAAAMAVTDRYSGLAVWSAFALALYVVGLSYLARKESMRGPLRFWPLLLLGAPIALALLIDDPGHNGIFALIGMLILWILSSLRHTFWSSHRQIGRTVSGLLAGIVLVDVLAVADQARNYGPVFAVLFGAALLFQKFVPAT